MDRDAIERRDFPTVRRGYDPAAVEAHLRRVADEIERGEPSPTTAPSLAAGASEQVRAILEAAEASAAQVRAEAGAEARDHLEHVQGAAGELSAQLDHLASELDRVLAALRAGAGRLNEGMLDLRARVEEFGPVADADPSPPSEPAAGHARSTDEEGARLAALEHALSGRPREEAERYLREHFELADVAALLDDVYSRAGR